MQGNHHMSFSIQKANFWKRISAFMFDAILAFCLMLGVGIGVSYLLDYDTKVADLKAIRAEIETEYEFEKYGLSFDISEEDYKKLDDTKKEIYDKANEAFLKEPRTGKTLRNLVVLAIANVGVSLLIADTVIYFVLPMLFKNGQTLGKKCFGLAVIRTNGVKVTPQVLLIRSVIGRFAMETIAPLTIFAMMLLGSLGFVGTITLALFAILEIGVMIYTNTNSCIHDLLSDTVVVDMSSQQIFETQEARTEYDKAEAARKAGEKENERPVATGIFAPKSAPEQRIAENNTVTETVKAETAETAKTEQAAETPATQTETPAEKTAQTTATEETSASSANEVNSAQ
jgi:uncharacterized RDD family membrane protein YckC